jgi:hypothetical protein
VLTPAGRRIEQAAGERPGFVELEDQGFYEVRARGVQEKRPLTVAVDLDPAESDLASADPQELVAAVMGHAASEQTTETAAPATPADAERRQALWWYLMLAAVALLLMDTIVSNRTALRV